MGDLAAGATQTIEVNYRVDRPGSFNYCGAFTAAGGLAGRDCVSTVAAAGQLNVSILGPQTAEVGSQVTFTIDIANQTDATLTHVVVSDRFDPGCNRPCPVATRRRIERDLQDDIPPHQSRQLAVTFQVTQPGQLCQDVVVTADGGLRSEAHTCLTVPNRQPPSRRPQRAADHPARRCVPPASPPATPTAPANPPSTPPPASVPPTTGPAIAGSLSVVASGPDRRSWARRPSSRSPSPTSGSEPLTNVVVASQLRNQSRSRGGHAAARKCAAAR